MTDPISDMLNRIRNAQAVFHPAVNIPFSKLKYELAKILEKKGLIGRIEIKRKKKWKIIRIVLKYDEEKKPVFSGFQRVSKPGQKIYKGYRKLKKVKSGYGIAIISTSKGLMADREAKRKKMGGEIICEIW